MPVQRSGPTPIFLEYITQYPLIPQSHQASGDLLDLAAFNIEWIDVPNYQRGISWNIENVEELLKSNSVLLGNVILGQFPVPTNRFPHLPAKVKHYAVLVDGLQRYSIGTIMLSVLHSLVLSQTPSLAADARHFYPLSTHCAPLAPVYQHNDTELRNHPRRAIADAYRLLHDAFKLYSERRFNRGEGQVFAQEIVNLFLNRQIATDLYFNFNGPIELTYTFLGINTIRVELSNVDLLRSFIVEKALSSSWTPSEIEEMENRFTGLFIESEKPNPELLPFASIVLDNLRDTNRANNVFPSWTGTLSHSDVDNFLEFVEEFFEVSGNGFINELRECGAVPFSALLSHYYHKFLLACGVRPAFFSGRSDEDASLHKFLCAAYRVLLGGEIGRTRIYAEKLFDGSISTLDDAADMMSGDFIHVSVNSQSDKDWLNAVLRQCDKSRAKRVFNAMRLPERSLGWGTTFNPDTYSSRSKDYNVDHLIPASTIDMNLPGGPESETLLNYAPLPSNQNRVAKATSCSSKLSAGGIYSNYMRVNSSPHPYCQWLMDNQGNLGSDLDRQELLWPNAQPDIGGDRIVWIRDYLLARL